MPVELLEAVPPAYSEILTPEALQFLEELARRFEPVRLERLAARVKVQARDRQRQNARISPRKRPKSAQKTGP